MRIERKRFLEHFSIQLVSKTAYLTERHTHSSALTGFRSDRSVLKQSASKCSLLSNLRPVSR